MLNTKNSNVSFYFTYIIFSVSVFFSCNSNNSGNLSSSKSKQQVILKNYINEIKEIKNSIVDKNTQEYRALEKMYGGLLKIRKGFELGGELPKSQAEEIFNMCNTAISMNQTKWNISNEQTAKLNAAKKKFIESY